MSELMLPQVINTEQLPALFGVRENGKSGIETYCSGFGYTKVLVDETELCIDEETLEITAYHHCKGFEVMGKKTRLTDSLKSLAKAEYNGYWLDFNLKYPQHKRPVF